MNDYDIDYDRYTFEIIDLLEDAGMTDQEEYPELSVACDIAKNTACTDYINGILQEHPWIVNEARQRIKNNPYMPLPKGEELNRLKGPLQLGQINYNLDKACIDPLDFTRGMMILGETGSGKTYFTMKLLNDLLSIPLNQRGFNILIIQVAKRDADFMLHQHPHIRLIEWEHLRRNIFEIEEWDNPEAKLNHAVSIFSASNYLMSMTQPILNECVDLCRKRKKTITFDNLFQAVTIAKGKLDSEGFETKNAAGKLKLRLAEFMKKPQLNTPRGFRIDKFWSKHDIILNAMDETNEYIHNTAITDILISLQRYYETTPVHPTRLRTLIVIDECRALFPVKQNNYDHDADKFMERFVTTRRSAGIGLITVTQEPQSVTSWLTNNAAYFLTFPIAGEALDAVKKFQNLTDEQISYIFKLPEKGTAIVRDRRFPRPYILQVPGDLQVTTITREQTKALMEPIIKEMHRALGIPAQTTQATHRLPKPIDQFPEQQQEHQLIMIGKQIMEYLIEFPFSIYTDVRDKLSLGDQAKKAIQHLQANGLIEIQKIRNKPSGGVNPQFLILTEKAQDFMKIPKKRRIKPSHFKHTFYEHKIIESIRFEALEEPIREFSIRNNPERIDVFAYHQTETGKKGYAYEVTLTTNRSDIIKNVQKCITNFSDYVDILIMVCETPADQKKTEKIIHEAFPEVSLEIHCDLIKNYL